MPLSNDKHFGVVPMTEAINRLPENHSTIGDLGLFKKDYKATTYIRVTVKDGKLSLIDPVPRGTPGMPVADTDVKAENFDMLHLPKDDVVRADDVQNLKAFGTENKAQSVAAAVNDKLEAMRSDIDYTREHLMLGAVQGKIMNSKGVVLVDIYERFKIKRQTFSVELSKETTKVNQVIDRILTQMKAKRKGESTNGWYVLASPEFMENLLYHKSMTDIYNRYQDGKIYRVGHTTVALEHKGIMFIQYDDKFDSDVDLKAGEAVLLPKGTRKTFREYFAPADMNKTINTKAKPYYASREPLPHDKGWSLHAQSNPLPLVLRPELCATLKMT